MAASAGLFELEDELAEPTTRYLELAGGRAAPLDASAAAAHFARAERVADEAAKPKRRWLLSRRTRRTLRRRAPLLVAAAAVIAVAAVAALAIVRVPPAHDPRGRVKTERRADRGQVRPGVVQITSKCPSITKGRFAWKPIVGTGVVIRSGVIATSAALFTDAFGDSYWRGDTYRYVENAFYPQRVTVEEMDPQGRFTRTPGFVWGYDPANGVALIVVDPDKIDLVAVPLGDSETLRVGKPLVALSRRVMTIARASGKVTKVWRKTNENGQKYIGGCT